MKEGIYRRVGLPPEVLETFPHLSHIAVKEEESNKTTITMVRRENKQWRPVYERTISLPAEGGKTTEHVVGHGPWNENWESPLLGTRQRKLQIVYQCPPDQIPKIEGLEEIAPIEDYKP